MITPMQKISIMCLASDSENTLTELRELGILHVTPCTEPSGTTIQDAHKRIEDAKTALTTLECETHHHQACSNDLPEDIDELIENICRKHQKIRHQHEHLTNLQHLHLSLLPYGDFNPETIKSLAERGIIVKLYHAREIEKVELDGNLQLHILSRDKTGTHFAVIGEKDFSVNATEFQLHDKSLKEVEAEITSVKLDIDFTQEKICRFAPLKQKIANALHEREESARYSEVHETIGRHGEISYLRGFCPTESIPQVQEAATKHGWGILTEDPLPEDETPTLLKFPKWVEPIKAVLEMLCVLPGYRETDISSVFLIFFSIFFAILIGDAGYGILFLAITNFTKNRSVYR